MLRCQQPLFVHGSGAWVGHFRSSATKTVTSTAITERRRHDGGESRQKRKAPDEVSARQHRGFPHCLTHGDFSPRIQADWGMPRLGVYCWPERIPQKRSCAGVSAEERFDADVTAGPDESGPGMVIGRYRL